MFKLPKSKIRPNKMHETKNQKGFTLIELLVVVMVISVLSGVVISLINSGGFRAKARDAQRIADLKQIQTALELYFSDYRQYPVSISWIKITGGDAALSNVLEPIYINSVPTDPLDSGTGDNDPCSSPENYRYNYRTSAGGATYILATMMQQPTSNDESMCGDLNNWASLSCGSLAATEDVCYGLENP